jgi:hypothetical protein
MAETLTRDDEIAKAFFSKAKDLFAKRPGPQAAHFYLCFPVL